MLKSNYDWKAHCQVLGLSSAELFQVADQVGLPRTKLTPRQSEQLLIALKRYAAKKRKEAIAQKSLF